MAIDIAHIESFLVRKGFSARADTNKKYKELTHNASGESVYLNKAEPKAYSQLIIHPRHLGKRISLLGAGVGIGSSRELRFGSNLRRFPQMMHNGARPCHYGVPFGFDSSESLAFFVSSVFG